MPWFRHAFGWVFAPLAATPVLAACPGVMQAAPGGALLDENIRERETAGAKHDECLAEKCQLFGSGHVCKTSAGEGCLHRAALLIGVLTPAPI